MALPGIFNGQRRSAGARSTQHASVRRNEVACVAAPGGQTPADLGTRTCLAAVARVVVLCVTLGRGACSDNTGAYCRARGKIPTVIIRRLALALADVCEQQLPDGWLWKGRHVHLVDGTTASMPDTVLNQA